MEDYLNDNVVISEEVMKMTAEERRAEIARLEAETAKEKERIEKKAGERCLNDNFFSVPLDSNDSEDIADLDKALEEKFKVLNHKKNYIE